ncbi:MAG: CRTAC1 family protein [Planctomycetaceae bacterium]
MSRATLTAVAVFLLAGRATADDAIRLVDVTDKAGLRKPLTGILGHGGAWGDFDGDGKIDLYVGGFSDRPAADYKPAPGPVPNRLLRNLGNGKFEWVRQQAVEVVGRTSGAVFADLDNNGTLELYVANNAKPAAARRAKTDVQRAARVQLSNLFRNDDGKLVDVSKASGAVPAALHTARNIGVFDYNGDGLLDLLVIEDRFRRNHRSVLLKNEGRLRFRVVNKETGLPGDLFGLGLAVADVNGDHRPDFFVGHSNRFFLSAKGGKYVEPPSLKKTFAWKPLHAEDWPCGAAFGDLNRDGRLDLVLSIHCETARNRVFLNDGLKNGVPRFRDVTKAVGLPDSVAEKSPHVEIQDFDNDGLPDLYFSTAWMAKDGAIQPLIYRNLGVKNGLPRFTAVHRPGKGEKLVYFPAGPSGDYDGDGRVDLFLINWFRGNHCRLLHNESRRRHWLTVKVTGKTFNRMGIGSQVRVYPAGMLGNGRSLLGFQELSTGYGYAGGQPAVCHFGLGDVKTVDLDVRFPNGRRMQLKDVEADRMLTVHE